MLAVIMERVSHGHIIRRAVHGKFGPHSDVLASGWTLRISIKRWGHPRARGQKNCRVSTSSCQTPGNTTRHGVKEISCMIKTRYKIGDNLHLVSRWRKTARSLRSVFPHSFIYAAFFITRLVVSRGEILRRERLKREWDRHIEANAVFIIGHYQLWLLGNVPFFVTRRSVCLMTW